MSSYAGRVALVTGASSGIGAGIAKGLVQSGLIVIGAARRLQLIQALAAELKGQPGRLVPRKLDVGNATEIEELFRWAEKEFGGIDILVNNAGLVVPKLIADHTPEELKRVLDVNLLGTLLTSRKVIKGFIGRKINDGYIININSLAGHKVLYMPGVSFGIYPITKYGVTAECEILRYDLLNAGIKARVTSISPGAVLSGMTSKAIKQGLIKEYITPQDIYQTIKFLLSLPKNVEITEMTVRPTGEVVAKDLQNRTPNKTIHKNSFVHYSGHAESLSGDVPALQ